MRRRVFLLGILSMVLLVSACSGGGGGKIVEVTGLDDFSFVPSALHMETGEEVTVNFINDGVLEHTFVLDDPSVRLTVIGGQAAEVTFTVPSRGTYTFYCDVPGHREGGMEGILSVL